MAASLIDARISIVIATRNCAEKIGVCIESILEQSMPEIEIIIQDACSTDGTVDAVRSFHDERLRVFVERDVGIYDAWNRALTKVRGEWVMFMGGDDRLAHRDVLSHRLALLERSTSGIQLMCGKIALVSEDRNQVRIVGDRWDWNKLQRFQNVAHIGLMHRHSLFAEVGNFNTEYKIAGDYEWLLRLGWVTNTIFIDDVEIMAGGDGVSQTAPLQVLGETFRIQRNRPGIGPCRAAKNFVIAAIKYLVRRAI